MKKSVLIAVLVLAVSLLAGFGGGLVATRTSAVHEHKPGTSLAAFKLVPCSSNTGKLTVYGTGKASATPDEFNIMISVHESGSTAASALSADNSKTANLVSVLKGAGVLPTDIKTTNFSLNPQYTYKGVLTGYSVSNDITAKLTSLSTAGSVIDAAQAAVGNAGSLQSLGFAVLNETALQSQARASAVRDAKVQAQAMALAAGEKIAGICSLSDVNSTPDQPYFNGAAMATSAHSVPLEAGTQQVSVKVKVVYGLVS
ncbi:MAG: SIMPL domain-containing protein [Acidimicrobiales bacterium]